MNIFNLGHVLHIIIGSYVFLYIICSPICNNGGMSYVSAIAIREGSNLSFLYQEWSEAPERSS